VLDINHGLSRIALRENGCLSLKLDDLPRNTRGIEKHLGIEIHLCVRLQVTRGGTYLGHVRVTCMLTLRYGCAMKIGNVSASDSHPPSAL
jgi:hypothetical protein